MADIVTDHQELGKTTIFGRNLAEIPCLRNSLLYGIGSGVVACLGTFMLTSRPKHAVRAGMGSYAIVTICYWCYCRYQYMETKLMYKDVQTALEQAAILEGSESVSTLNENKGLIDV